MGLREDLRLNKEKATIEMFNLLQDSSLSTQPGPQNSSAVAKVQEREGKFPPLGPNPAPTANTTGGGESHWESPGRTCPS